MSKTEEPVNVQMGYISLHRAIRNHWIWKDPIKLRCWIDILMECNHSSQKVNFGYEMLECDRGQSLNSLLTWSKRWGMELSTARRFLKMLENENMICLENVKKTTRLTVCKYDTYNSSGNVKETRKKPERIQSEFQHNTNNNVNNNVHKNVSIGATAPPTPTDQELVFKNFQDWIFKWAPEVGKMTKPFTMQEMLLVKKQLSKDELAELLLAMQNKKDLNKKYSSAYLTVLSWHRLELKRGNKAPVIPLNNGKTVTDIRNEEAERILNAGSKKPEHRPQHDGLRESSPTG